jgi:predicted Abi (CAAX) family protease
MAQPSQTAPPLAKRERSPWQVAGLAGTLLAALSVLVPAVGGWLRHTLLMLVATLAIAKDLLLVGGIAFLIASLLAPLEALGWWAGWYGEDLQTVQTPGMLAEPLPEPSTITRYVIYLDGIAQGKYTYLPDVEEFLAALAADMPDDIVLIKGIMSYSVINRSLTERRMLAFFWRLADRLQMSPSGGVLGLLLSLLINLRNVIVVGVTADQRYGPIYGQGTAQVIFNSLMNYGYRHNSGIPVTLLGYSGGAQISLRAALTLKQLLKAPIDVISLAGVISGNHNLLELEHLYHLVGDRDWVEKQGAVLFPQRWRLFPLSPWNRARQRRKITISSLGSMGHNGADGPYSISARLPDGRTHLEATVRAVSDILQGKSALVSNTQVAKPSNYERYWQAAFNRPDYYPLSQTVDPALYRAIAPWMGRLILPKQNERRQVRGVWFEIHHAPPEHAHLVGQIAVLRWQQTPGIQFFLQQTTRDVFFSEETEYSICQGLVHPLRLDRWQQVEPLESLAGSRPYDDVLVMLDKPTVQDTQIDGEGRSLLSITREPVQITGRYYALATILEPVDGDGQPWLESAEAESVEAESVATESAETRSAETESAETESAKPAPEYFRIQHFNRATRQFDGPTEIVHFPPVMPDANGLPPSTTRGLEQSPAGRDGWYLYGAKDAAGVFVVQAIAPRTLLRLTPDQTIGDRREAWQFLKRDAWNQIIDLKGNVRSTLLSDEKSDESSDSPKGAASQTGFSEGAKALVIHLYGGIGGAQAEPQAQGPLYFGHFAYGVATVVREPLADELIFDIHYHQVYTHNTDGVIAGTLAWHRFLGDRQFGWLGVRPVCDLVIQYDPFTNPFDFGGVQSSALDGLLTQLEIMTARYRVGDGTGGTYVGPAHNCSQDSNQALYAAVKNLGDVLNQMPELKDWFDQHPDQAARFRKLVQLGCFIKREMLPLGTARADWKTNDRTLGVSPESEILYNLTVGLISWRTLLPRIACETIARQFLNQGARIWVLQTCQVGGDRPEIAPVAPTPLGW